MTRRRWWIAMALVTCAATAQAALVGHWRMGEAATWDGSAWSIPDQTANPATATTVDLVEADRVEGAPLSTELPSYGMGFDAVAYASIGTPAKLDITDSLTVTAWVNPSGLQGAGAHASFQPIIGKGDFQYMLRYHRDQQDFHFFTQDGGWHQVDAAPDAAETFPPNEWYFVVGRVDSTATSNQVSVWVNGVLGGQADGGITTSADAVEIGRNSSTADRVFNGVIDDVRVYDHALTEAEILALYGERIAPPEITQDPVIDPREYVVAGTDVTITSVVDGTPPISVQWLQDGTPVPGGTNAILSLTGVAVSDSGAYSMVATSQYGSVTSAVASLTVSPAGAITFHQQPVGATRYINGSTTFSTIVTGEEPLALQWTLNGTDIPDATNETLTVTDITTADGGDYVLVASNDTLSNPSDTAVLTVLEPVSGSYEEAVVNAAPIAYWRLEETGGTTAFEYMSGYDGTHVGGVTPNVVGPRPPALPDLPADNVAARYDGESGGTDTGASIMSARPAFTIMGWFNPAEMPQVTTTNLSERVGLFGQDGVTEFGFHGGTTLGCWSPGGFVSFDPTGIVLVDTWYFIACTGDGTNMNLYLDAGRVSAIENVTADYGSSGSAFHLGYEILDPSDNWFNGAIDEVAVFDRALSALEISTIRSAAGPVPPVVTEPPVDSTRYAGLTAQFTVNVAGTLPIGHQWRKGGVPLVDGGDISGATTPTLTIANLEPGDAGGYDVVATNELGAATSVSAALAVVVPPEDSYEEAVVARKPIAYWTLNETSGTTGYDYAGGYDLAHGEWVLVGEPGPRPPTWPGMETDNPGVDYDQIILDDQASTTSASLMNNHAQFTIMGWINPFEIPSFEGDGGDRVALFGQNNAAEFGFHGPGAVGIWTPGGGFVSANPSNLLTAGEWSFLAATGDGEALKLYVDGELVASEAGSTDNYGFSTEPFRIGYAVLDDTGNEFRGLVDDVAVYDHALSVSDIQTVYGLAADVQYPVVILQQPTDVTLYAGAPAAAEFSVVVSGSQPLTYTWRKNGTPLMDGGNISGSATDRLSIFPVAAADQGSYDVVIVNVLGSATSTAAALTVVEPEEDSYAEAILALDPAGYWPLNEPTGSVIAVEGWNGRNGTYRSAAIPGVEGVIGNGFPAGNTAVQITADTAEADVALPSMGFNTNTVTLACWFKTDGTQGGFRGLVFLRAGGTTSGLHFGNGNELRYSWNDSFWWYDQGPVAPTNEWVFAALVVQPDQATLHLGVNGVLQSSINAEPHPNSNFNNSPIYIGWDPNSTGRHFNGTVDEVMILDRALSVAEIQSLYFGVVGEPVNVDMILDPDGNMIISWPAGDVLESAVDVIGPWAPVPGAVSPYTMEPMLPREFFRIVE